jgi:DNA-binding XRE family transcriptional regulator
MEITRTASDDAVLKELGERLSRYRLNSNLTQESLANEAGISKRMKRPGFSGGGFI